MRRLIIAASAVIAFAAAAHAQPTPVRGTPIVLTSVQQQEVKEGLLAVLKDPDSAKFGPMFAVQSANNVVVCGYVNAKNGFGGYTGQEPYLGDIINDKYGVGGVASSPGEASAVLTVCGQYGVAMK